MLVPYLDEQFSSWKHAILGYASQIGDAEAALRNIAEQRLSAMQRVCRGEPALDLDLLKRACGRPSENIAIVSTRPRYSASFWPLRASEP